jgi:hypothetical protein
MFGMGLDPHEIDPQDQFIKGKSINIDPHQHILTFLSVEGADNPTVKSTLHTYTDL